MKLNYGIDEWLDSRFVAADPGLFAALILN